MKQLGLCITRVEEESSIYEISTHILRPKECFERHLLNSRDEEVMNYFDSYTVNQGPCPVACETLNKR